LAGARPYADRPGEAGEIVADKCSFGLTNTGVKDKVGVHTRGTSLQTLKTRKQPKGEIFTKNWAYSKTL
jgi:hypothetical protein